MSQEKVERYKQEKAHRKENVEKERRKKKAGKFLTWAVILAVCGVFAGKKLRENKNAKTAAQNPDTNGNE